MDPASSAPIRLLLADDHYVVRSGFAASLELEPDFKVIAEAESGEQAVAIFRTVHPDAVLMDVRFPGGMDGIAATAAIREESPEARVLMYSTFDRGEDIGRSLLAGASGYVLKSAPREEVVRAIRTIVAGGRHVEGLVAHRLGERLVGLDSAAPVVRVLQLIAGGGDDRQIAAALQVAEDAVPEEVARLFAQERRRGGLRSDFSQPNGRPEHRGHTHDRTQSDREKPRPAGFGGYPVA